LRPVLQTSVRLPHTAQQFVRRHRGFCRVKKGKSGGWRVELTLFVQPSGLGRPNAGASLHVNRISGWWERRSSAVEWNTIDLTVAGGADLVVAGDDRAGVQRAERTAGVAAVLQGDHPLRVRHPHAFAREVDELLRRVAFLASDRASWITGGDFAIDGGMRKEV
jgi:hypothetical protein